MHRILAAVDFSDATQPVLRTSAEWARQENAALSVLYAMPEPILVDTIAWSGGTSVVPPIMHDENDFAQSLNRVHEAIEAIGLPEAECLCERGDAVETIREVAARIHADLIVIGSHGHGRFFHALFGSVREALLASPPCPVLVVPGRTILS
jgi:nucleotide-binding universal stress UspA family protein